MKTLSASLKVLVVASLACAAGLAAAADSQSLVVTAKVNGMCKFSATSTPLTFADINPSDTDAKTMDAEVIYKCTNGTPSAGVTATDGLNRNLTAPSGTQLAYTLAFSGGTKTGGGFGAGKELKLAVTGTIAASAYQNATAGTYSETVTLNITP